MAHRLGLNCKLYLNTGSYESPVWVEISNVRDLTLTLEVGESDVTTRGNGGWEAIVATLKKATIEFEMVWNKADTNFQALRTAFLTNGSVEVACMDDGIETVGAEGLRATMAVMKFNRNEELAEAVRAAVTLRPTYADHAPEWLTIAA